MRTFFVTGAAEWLGILGICVGVSALAIILVTAPVVLVTRGTPRIALDIEDGDLVVRLGRRDAAFAFRRRIAIPLTEIAGVTTPATRTVPRRGMRLPGTEVPGFLRAGSYGRGAKREFWDVRRGATVLVIETTGAPPYARLVLEVADPAGQAARLRAALSGRRGRRG
ncbi:MAG TPA: hypothetical protein VD931_02040 [Baekduia sp.]|nr:hypothetical protein [Baekduia sp.]